MDTAYSIIIVLLAITPLSLASVLWMLRHAPEGYEDRNGFHFKQRPAIRRRDSFAAGILRAHKAS